MSLFYVSAKKKQSATHKHVPHCHKPAHLVAKRNARERRRVEAVNQAFGRLRKSIPNETNKTRRLSKVKILQKAMDYIKGLHNMLMTSELSLQSANNHKMQEQ
ncbi:Uncharacterised protein g6913 [Pycnogonum litorale]